MVAGFNDGMMNGVPESFNSGPTSMNSRPSTQGVLFFVLFLFHECMSVVNLIVYCL